MKLSTTVLPALLCSALMCSTPAYALPTAPTGAPTGPSAVSLNQQADCTAYNCQRLCGDHRPVCQIVCYNHPMSAMCGLEGREVDPEVDSEVEEVGEVEVEKVMDAIEDAAKDLVKVKKVCIMWFPWCW